MRGIITVDIAKNTAFRSDGQIAGVDPGRAKYRLEVVTFDAPNFFCSYLFPKAVPENAIDCLGRFVAG